VLGLLVAGIDPLEGFGELSPETSVFEGDPAAATLLKTSLSLSFMLVVAQAGTKASVTKSRRVEFFIFTRYCITSKKFISQPES